MTNFESISIPVTSRGARSRINQRDIVPGSVKSRQLASDILQNSSKTEVPFSIDNGVTITVTFTIYNAEDSNIRLGVAPFMIAFFEGSTLSSSSFIPGSVATGRYTIMGPFGIPNMTAPIIGTDSNNVVYKTCIANNSGSSQNCIAVTQARFFQGIGGNVA